MTTSTTTFTRDRFTWLAYVLLGYYSYMQAALGPLVVFVRAELNLDYTTSGLHLSAFALGMMTAGLLGDRVARRFGRPLMFWGGGAGMALGAILLTVGGSPAVTILSALAMSLIGSFLLVMIQATLADRHGAQRAFALTEANVFASLTAALAPLMVGFTQSSAMGWRVTLYVGALAWLLLWLTHRHVTLPAAQNSTTAGVTTRGKRLPRAFWAYWLIVFLGVSIEWCMIFWAADFMEKVAGLSKDVAAASVSLFFVASVIGRGAGSALTRRFATGRLLLIAALIILVGFPLFWLGRTPTLNITGLFLCGLGVANLFPLTLSAAVGVAADQSNKASGRISLAGGTAILITPQILGTAADQIGIFNAYGIVVPVLAAVIAVTWYANRLVTGAKHAP